MCKICQTMKTAKTAHQRVRALAQMALAVRAEKVPQSHFQEAMDVMLGTTLQEQDEELDDAWERGHRPQTPPC